MSRPLACVHKRLLHESWGPGLDGKCSGSVRSLLEHGAGKCTGILSVNEPQVKARTQRTREATP